MTGARLQDGTDWSGSLAPGSYWRREGIWYALTPNNHLANLSHHTVTEHDDGTITVSPSILISARSPYKDTQFELWHGWLERGVWRACQ